MLKLYHNNQLTVTEVKEHSVYVDGGEYGDVSLRETPSGIKTGDSVNAYVYLDVSDEIVATMATAYVAIGECAYLEVISSNNKGTYLNWGLPKDLLLPFSEQLGSVRKGDVCFVYVYQDENLRPIASMKLHRHLDEQHGDLKMGDTVDLVIAGESELGFKAVINNEQLGLIYHDELARPLEIGSTMKGWVKKIRDDGKINLNINRLDGETRDKLEAMILSQLDENDGHLSLSDKSSPDLIYSIFKVSKKNFKRALGNLYKQRLISISPKSIQLVSKSNPDSEE